MKDEYLKFIEEINNIRKENFISLEAALKKYKSIHENDERNILVQNDLIDLLMTFKDETTLLIDVINKYNENEADLDIYINNLDYELAATYCCSDDPFSDYAKTKYKNLLYRKVCDISENSPNYYNIYIDDSDCEENEDYDKLSNELKRFLYDCAGYCSAKEYDKIYSLDEYSKGPVFDVYDISLKYNIDLDYDLFGSHYEEFKNAYDSNMSKEDFEKLYNKLTNNEE